MENGTLVLEWGNKGKIKVTIPDKVNILYQEEYDPNIPVGAVCNDFIRDYKRHHKTSLYIDQWMIGKDIINLNEPLINYIKGTDKNKENIFYNSNMSQNKSQIYNKKTESKFTYNKGGALINDYNSLNLSRREGNLPYASNYTRQNNSFTSGVFYSGPDTIVPKLAVSQVINRPNVQIDVPVPIKLPNNDSNVIINVHPIIEKEVYSQYIFDPFNDRQIVDINKYTSTINYANNNLYI